MHNLLKKFQRPFNQTGNQSSGGSSPSTNNALAAWDVYQPSTMDLRGARSFTGATGQYFSTTVDANTNKPLCLSEDATYTKCFMSWWMRFDNQSWINSWGSAVGENAVIFGVQNASYSRISWIMRFRNPSTPLGIDFIFGSNPLGTTNVQTNKVLRATDSSVNLFGSIASGSATPLTDMWHHCCLWIDGSQASGDSNRLHFWLDGVQQVTGSGSVVPAKFSIPAAGNSNNFFLNLSANAFKWSIMDVAICASIPSNEATAVAAAYNSGLGLTYAQWIANNALPTPLQYYKCDDNMVTATGAAPSGNLVNAANPGTYDLTISGSPVGECQVPSWTDIIGNTTAYFGYTPTLTTGHRGYWGIYKPTGRNGKPCVYTRPLVGNSGASAAYAIAHYSNLNTAMGSSGSMIVNAILNFKGAVSADNNLLSVSDDITNAGTGCNTRILSNCYLGYNAYSNPVSLGTVTFNAASTGVALVCNKTSHGLIAGDHIWFVSSDASTGAGALPSPLKAYPYYINNNNSSGYTVKAVNSSTFNICELSTPTTAITGTTSSNGNGSTYTAYYSRDSSVTCQLRPTSLSWSGQGAASTITYTLPIGREYNQFGIELPGIPAADLGYGTAIYPAIGTENTFEICNNGNGTNAVNYAANPNGPFNIFMNGASQPVMYHDDGGAGAKDNMWGGTYAALNVIGMQASMSVDTVTHLAIVGVNQGEVYYGRLLITKPNTFSVRAGLHSWCQV